MFVWIRSHMRKLMLAVTILTIVAFTFLYNTTELDQLSSGKFAEIYGQSLTLEQLQREARSYQLALALGLSEYVSTLDGLSGESDPGAFALNTMIISHEAHALGIQPTDAEIAEAIAAVPAFQSNGVFDQSKYDQFKLNFLAPNGLTAVELEQVVRGSLQFERLSKIIESAPATSEAELIYNARLFQPVSGAAVVFPREKYFEQTSASDEDIQVFYEANKFQLLTSELRTANVATFALSEADAKLADAERIEALQKIADQSAQFADAAAESSFSEAAKSLDVPVETTLPFNSAGQIVPAEGAAEPDTNLNDAVVGTIAPTAFALSESSPLSGILQDGDSFHVIELASVIPARQKTFEESRDEITADLRNLEAEGLLESGADEAVEQIRSDLRAGKSLADATAAFPIAEIKSFADVSPTGQTASPDQRAYADETVPLKEGEISGVTITPSGGSAVYLEKRASVEESEFGENREQMKTFIQGRKGSILLYEWLEAAAEHSGLRFAAASDDLD